MSAVSLREGGGFLYNAPHAQLGVMGGHLKYRIIPSQVGKRIRGNDVTKCSLA
jgi:hypothetical protein